MSKLTLPTTKSIVSSHRLEQNLTCLAPGVSGTALLSVIWKTRCAQLWQPGNKPTGAVKLVILTLCMLSCTEVFTLWPRILWQEKPIPEPKTKSSGGRTTRTGGSDPTFWASIRPKGFLGSLPPVLAVDATTDPAAICRDYPMDQSKTFFLLRHTIRLNG